MNTIYIFLNTKCSEVLTTKQGINRQKLRKWELRELNCGETILEPQAPVDADKLEPSINDLLAEIAPHTHTSGLGRVVN